jgi:hypothetical protein
MSKLTTNQKQQLKEATKRLEALEAQLAVAKKAQGIDEYISVKVLKNQARYERSHALGAPRNGVGKFFMLIAVTAKKHEVLIPLSMASGKKTAGLMYHIEGTGEGAVAGTDVRVSGDGVCQITIGTLQFCKIPAGSTAEFRVQVNTRGQAGKTYRIIISRLSYKLSLTETRYQQYLRPLPSTAVKFS